MKKIKEFFNWLVSLLKPNQKTPPHEHSWQELFRYTDSQKGEYKTFFQCTECGQQKTE